MKIKILPLFLVSLVSSFLFVSCFYGIKGSGNVVKDERQVNSFESISVSAGLELILTQDSVNKVVVEADDNLQKIIITEVSHGELKIYPEKGIRHAASKKIFVSFREIRALEASSGAEVKSKANLKLHGLNISVSSGADIDLILTSDKVTANGSSGGRMELSGSTESVEVDGSSGVDIRASGLTARNCIAGASSGANLKVSATEKIAAKASSGGQIKVSGQPKERNIEKSSGGDVTFE